MAATANPNSGEAAGGEAPSGVPNFEELAETMKFDPFGPPSTDGDEGESGEAGASADGDIEPQGEASPQREARQDSQPAATPPPASPEPPAPEGEPKDASLETLRSMVTNLLAKEASGNTQGQGQAPQAQPQAPQQPAGEAASPAYRLNLPLELVEAFESENRETRHAALNGLTNSIMNRLAADFREAMMYMHRDLVQRVPATVQSMTEAQRQQQAVEQDFYGAFPQLRELEERLPAARQIIWSTVQQAAQRQGITQWNPEFRDQVGTYISASLGVQRQAAQAPVPQGNGAQAPRPRPRTPFAAGSGSPARGAEASETNDFMDVLTAGSV